MATFDDRATVERLVRNNGHYDQPGTPTDYDPPVLRITEYTNAWGKRAWGVVYPGDELDRYRESDFVREPTIIFEHAPHQNCNWEGGRE